MALTHREHGLTQTLSILLGTIYTAYEKLDKAPCLLEGASRQENHNNGENCSRYAKVGMKDM